MGWIIKDISSTIGWVNKKINATNRTARDYEWDDSTKIWSAMDVNWNSALIEGIDGWTLSKITDEHFEDYYSVDFDSVGKLDLAETLEFPVHNTPHSISFWFKRDVLGSWDSIMGNHHDSQDNHFPIFNETGSRIYCESEVNGDSIVWTLSPVPTAGKWYHFVCTFDGSGSGNCYYDTNKMAIYNDTISNKIKINVIGHMNGIHGDISEIAIYNKELTQDEVTSIYNLRQPYNHKKGSISDNLIHWWRMGDGDENASQTVVYDMAGSVNARMDGLSTVNYVQRVPW